jgi:hypothetical protein
MLASWFVAPLVVPLTQGTYVVEFTRVVEVVLDHLGDQPARFLLCAPWIGSQG